MIEQAQYGHQAATAQTDSAQGQRAVLKMKSHTRMAGSVPVWEAAETPAQQIENRLAHARNATKDSRSSFRMALAEQATENGARPDAASKPFGFGDLIDMVNPLHHIPVVGSLYRSITGDEIRGSSRMVGGAVFGGPVGAATGLADIVMERETGRNISDSLVHYARTDLLGMSENGMDRLENRARQTRLEELRNKPYQPVTDVEI